MQGILLIVSGLGWTVDFVLLVLDLNYWLVSSLISFLFWTIHLILNLPGTIGLGLLHFWECVLVGITMVGESSYSLLLGAVQTVGDAIKGVLAGLDSMQLVWNLLCNMVIRSREVMQRGFINIMVFGQNLHCQVWEVLTIASSLTAYLVNTLVNLSLIAVQNILAAVLSLWFSIVNVIFAGKELIFTLFSQLSSTAVAVVVLVWAPFQMAVDVLVSCSTGVGAIMFKYVYEFLLLLLLIWISCMVFRPSPRSFQDALSRLYRVVHVFLYVMINSDIWRRVADRSLYLLRICRTAWSRDVNQLRTRAQSARLRAHHPAGPTQTHSSSVVRPLNPILQPTLHYNGVSNRVQTTQEVHHSIAAYRGQTTQAVPLEPQGNVSTSRNTQVAAGDPWKLLKQQEESRKCVICQDETKTVLLLPCRHLCLCAHCTQILMQQPILQRNCPLCRQMILQTLTVYM